MTGRWLLEHAVKDSCVRVCLTGAVTLGQVMQHYTDPAGRKQQKGEKRKDSDLAFVSPSSLLRVTRRPDPPGKREPERTLHPSESPSFRVTEQGSEGWRVGLEGYTEGIWCEL